MGTEQELLNENQQTLSDDSGLSQWQQLKKRLSSKIKAAKDTSVVVRGEQAAKYLRAEVDLDHDPDIELGPSSNSYNLIQGIKSGSIDISSLSADERRIVVKALREQGRTQDEIAAMLKVSRRTIVADCHWLRMAAAQEVKKLDVYLVAGEVYSTAQAIMQKAIQEGMYKTVSTVMRDMVEILQSLGIIYRAPTQMRSMNMNVTASPQAFMKYMETISGEEDKVIAVLGEVMRGLEETAGQTDQKKSV